MNTALLCLLMFSLQWMANNVRGKWKQAYHTSAFVDLPLVIILMTMIWHYSMNSLLTFSFHIHLQSTYSILWTWPWLYYSMINLQYWSLLFSFLKVAYISSLEYNDKSNFLRISKNSSGTSVRKNFGGYLQCIERALLS